MTLRFIGKIGLALTLPLLASTAFASGSDSFGGESSDQSQYNTGKAVYAQKLACPDCPLAGKTLDKMLAEKLISDPSLTTKLTAEERMPLMSYLKRRFKL